MTEENALCPCGSELEYETCCGKFHSGNGIPETAEALMRSRYSAFAKNEFGYLNDTNHSTVENKYDTEQNRELYKQFDWQELQILATENGSKSDSEGYVDFVARYTVGGGEHAIREKSLFKKEDGRWYYMEGKSLQIPQKNSEKVGRNDPCPCGSGKKYKKCCMNK